MSVLAVIQARLGSTRFPMKILAPLHGTALINHVIRRVRAIPSVTEVVVVVPATDAFIIGDILEDTTTIVSCPGPENDVLARFASVAAAWPDHHTLMRVTADCPLLDPEIAEAVIQLYLSTTGAAYAWNVSPGYVDGEDVEVFDREALLWAHAKADAAEDREHVTPFLRRHLSVATLPPKDDRGWTLKTSVDTPEDLAVVAQLMH